jgi:hypothetical protein
MSERGFGPDDLLSVVVVTYNQQRELPRTLYSLSPQFQRGIRADQYEVIVVDNGSKKPTRRRQFDDLGIDLSVMVMDDPTHSPVAAINRGLDASVGAAVSVFIDGARLASPGLLRGLREGLMLDPRAVVGSRGRYLGPVPQRVGMRYGYTRKIEDTMLDRVKWKKNGYRLFDISVFDEPSGPTWLAQVGESNSIAMSRELWAELGGFDEAFVSKGGGYVNLDTWNRACSLPRVRPVLLLGEATFHQFHGGVATNSPQKEVRELHGEYKKLRGKPYRRPSTPATFLGSFTHTPPPHELVWTDGVNFIDLVDLDGPMKNMLPLMKRTRDKGPIGTIRFTVKRLRRSTRVRRIARVLPAGGRRRLKAVVRRVRR